MKPLDFEPSIISLLNVECGIKRRYKKEAEVKIAAKALNLRYLFCGTCDAYHLNHIGIKP